MSSVLIQEIKAEERPVYLVSRVDRDQEEEKNDVEVKDAPRHISSSSFLSQRITRSKAKELGSRLQMFSLFVVSFV